jgi:porin
MFTCIALICLLQAHHPTPTDLLDKKTDQDATPEVKKSARSEVMAHPNQYLNITSASPVEPGTDFFYGNWPWGSDGITGSWGGAREQLIKDGIYFIGEYTSMLQQNLTGGSEQAFFGAGIAQFELTFDAETMIGIQGGLLFMNYSYSSWYNAKFEPFGSFSPVGSTVGVNNNFPQTNVIDQGQIDQLYWQQVLFDDQFQIAFGKIDSDVMFMSIEPAGGFMYGSSCVPPTAIQFIPSFPNAATGLQMQLDFGEHLSGAFGWWDGTSNAYNPETGLVGPNTGNRGPASFFNNDGNWYLVSQWDASWETESALPGLASVGGWVQTGTTVTQGNSTTGVDDVPGVYLQAQQIVWAPDPVIASEGGGVAVFARTDWSPEDKNALTYAATAGVSATGVIPGRPADAVGLMGTWTKFSDNPEIYQSTLANGQPGASGGAEGAIEAFYRLQINPHLLVQAGIEWISTPGGGDPSPLDDAVVPYLIINLQF